MDRNELSSTSKFAETIDFVSRILTLFPYPNLKVCFNGGKDATVVLHLVKIAQEQLRINSQIECIYFKEEHPFPEIVEFMNSQKNILNLNIDTHSDVKSGLNAYKNLQAVIMGTRRSDPHGKNLDRIALTDNGYPNVLRINPILDWNYQDVWEFIRVYQIPYCRLYDKGYMCLGSRLDTKPNSSYKEGMKPWDFEGHHERLDRSE